MLSAAQALSLRKADLEEMVPQAGGKQRLVFEAPSRGLIGFRSAFATLTRGTGILHRAFSRYAKFKGPLDGVRKGVLISTAGAHPSLHLCHSPGINLFVACHSMLFWAARGKENKRFCCSAPHARTLFAGILHDALPSLHHQILAV